MRKTSSGFIETLELMHQFSDTLNLNLKYLLLLLHRKYITAVAKIIELTTTKFQCDEGVSTNQLGAMHSGVYGKGTGENIST